MSSDDSSSMDPISILSNSSPLKQNRRTSKGPLAQRSRNLQSPSRSMVFKAVGDDRKSPVRIRVTVQEESNTSPSRRLERNAKSMTVPLKDSEQSSPVKRRSRRTSNDVSLVDSISRSVRKPTPPRRRVTPARNTRPIVSDRDDESIHSPLIDLHTGQISTDYGIETRSLAELSVEHSNPQDDQIDYSLSVLEPMHEALREDEHVDFQSRDAAMWRAMVQPDTQSAKADVEAHDTSGDYSLSENESRDTNGGGDEDEDDRLPITIPGEMTVLESEEFSMISVDSLSSHQTGQSPAVSTSHLKHSKPATSSAVQRLKADLSYLPSSPPMITQSQYTPVIDEPTPSEPPALVNAQMNFLPVMTPLRESAVRSGRVLQDIVRSPDPNRLSSKLEKSGHSIFGGFSTGTRRQLRASLQAGAKLAEDTSPVGNPTRYLSPSHFTKDTRSHHRLPTPEDHDRSRSNITSTTDTTVGVVYPELQNAQHAEGSSMAKSTYDAMSWIPTGRAALVSPVSATQTSSGLGIQTQESAAPHLPGKTAGTKSCEAVPVSMEEGDDDEEEDADALEPEDRDIWQDEASRSLEEEEDSPSELVEVPIRPRRGKLPGTWRRQSGNNFHYSDSPEPEDLEKRKTSADSSAEDSAIATPPSSDGDYAADEVEENEDVEDSQEGISPSSDGDALTPGSDVSVQDGDDTGLFWQANMTSVFNRQGRPLLRKEEADISMVSELKSLSSPPKHSKLNMRPCEGRVEKTENSCSALVTPLRKSLLKSGKVRSSPLAQNVSFLSTTTDEADQSGYYDESTNGQSGVSRTQDSSMASDTRQLLGEMATARRRASAAMEDIMHSRQSISQNLATDVDCPTESNLTKSYIENLNHGSPTKVTVNFNDSSIMGSSSLLAPRKTYPVLFDDVRLNPPADPAKEIKAAAVSPPSPVRLISRLTNSFWDAIVGTDGSKDIPPQANATVNSATSPSKLERESTTVPGTNVSDDVLRLRRKYGLLTNAQPFTMAHIRTLHRMLISTRQHASASIIPTGPPLPTILAPFLNTTRRAGDTEIVIDKTILATVAAFMGLLLSQPEIERLQALGSWGDEGAKKARGFDSRGRHGSYLAFAAQGSSSQEKAARKAGEMKGAIEATWVVDVVIGILEKESVSGR